MSAQADAALHAIGVDVDVAVGASPRRDGVTVAVMGPPGPRVAASEAEGGVDDGNSDIDGNGNGDGNGDGDGRCSLSQREKGEQSCACQRSPMPSAFHSPLARTNADGKCATPDAKAAATRSTPQSPPSNPHSAVLHFRSHTLSPSQLSGQPEAHWTSGARRWAPPSSPNDPGGECSQAVSLAAATPDVDPLFAVLVPAAAS